jgi:hypothetical protein
MDAIEWAVVGGMGLLILAALVYAIVRLMHEPRTGLDQRSTRLARLFLYPRFLDPLLAKPMTGREKIGWLIVVALMVAAVVFTAVTGIGVRR